MLQKVIVPSLFPRHGHYSIVNKNPYFTLILIVVIIMIMDCKEKDQHGAPRKDKQTGRCISGFFQSLVISCYRAASFYSLVPENQ